ncbi:MAG: FkbM family methyltransferase [Actinomycetota bacterium]|nr:FkbM family methyltransferase [Actinomycetota bacterium]
MPANSIVRRLVKRPLARFQWTPAYRLAQAAAMAWDIRTGAWSEPELDLITHAVQPGESALDIGANFGLWSYHLARATGPKGRVLAFEPVPFTYRCLRLVAKILRMVNVEMLAVGCGEQRARVRFLAPAQDSGAISAGLVHLAGRGDRGEASAHERASCGAELWCDVVALDELLADLPGLSFVKCDIEGSELFAFRGAERLIDEHLPSVVCEIDPSFVEGFGLALEEVVGFFWAKQYELFRYDQHPPRLCRVLATRDLAAGNYLFVHPSRLGRFAGLLV